MTKARSRKFLLKDKRHLSQLKLTCKPRGNDGQPLVGEEAKKIQELFEEDLFPPPSTEVFLIEGYLGLQFPSWMGMIRTSDLPLLNLKILQLTNCLNCHELPPLGLLPNLIALEIDGASAIKSIGPEFTGIGEGAMRPSICNALYPKLELLQFKNMPSLVEWIWNAEYGVKITPCFAYLELFDYPNLESLLLGLSHDATSLERPHP